MRDYEFVRIGAPAHAAMRIAIAPHRRMTYRDVVERGIALVIEGLESGALDPAEITGYRIPAGPVPRKRRTGRRVTENNDSTRNT